MLTHYLPSIHLILATVSMIVYETFIYNTAVTVVIQMRKLRHREVISEIHTRSKQQSKDLNLVPHSISSFHFMNGGGRFGLISQRKSTLSNLPNVT